MKHISAVLGSGIMSKWVINHQDYFGQLQGIEISSKMKNHFRMACENHLFCVKCKINTAWALLFDCSTDRSWLLQESEDVF